MTEVSIPDTPVSLVTPNAVPRWQVYWRYMPAKTRKEKRAMAKDRRKHALALKRIQ